jgi:hypothetical protein
MIDVTHVLVVYPMGHWQVVSLEAYMAAPASFVAATHARLLNRRDLIRERARAAGRARR